MGKGERHLRNGVIRQTQDSVEFTKGKRQSRLLGSLTEQLTLDRQVSNLKRVL